MGISSKQKRVAIKAARAKRMRLARTGKRTTLSQWALHAALKDGTMIPVNRAKVVSRCAIPKIPDFYCDRWFDCRDCGTRELWTAKQQQRWYEEQGGEIETIAISCNACRRKEKLRRAAARKVHQEGLERKRVPRAGKTVPPAPSGAKRE